ncbi:MAG: cyclic nucleotide-binding domain-containing protein [Halobacteriovoraceae bacterium]|nr:cyclic nucleotide-binding domain-containing protein [Halobacteriovoraceae bacterium]
MSEKGKNLNILLVEDRPEVIENVISSIEDHRIVVANDGNEALLKYRNESFSLIITELNIAKTNGIEILKEVLKLDLKNGKKEKTKFIFITDDTSVTHILSGYRNVTHIGRDFSIKDLEESIHSFYHADGNDVFKEIVPLAAGETLFHEDQEADELFFILDGELEVSKTFNGQEKVIGKIHKGEVVGELAVLRSNKRNATVKAITDCKVAKVNSKIIIESIKKQPTLVKILINCMMERIDRLNEELCSR